MKIETIKDKEKAEKIRQAIKANDGYCPCVLKKTKDTKCMCKEFIERTTSGYCHCGLYYKTVDEDDE